MKNLLLLFVVLMSSCKVSKVSPITDPYAALTDPKIKEIVKASIEFHGGLERWQNVRELSYNKVFALLLEDGEVERQIIQRHTYSYEPLNVEIYSKENGKKIISNYSNGEYTRQVDGKSLDLEPEKIAKGMNSSLYVIGMPYKLLDPGAVLTYLGEREMEDGKTVDVISVKYNAEKYPTHSSSEPWEYYFDQSDRRIVANRVTSSDHLNLVENLSYSRVNGFLINKERKSYRIDAEGHKLYLRASYLYDKYEIQLR